MLEINLLHFFCKMTRLFKCFSMRKKFCCLSAFFLLLLPSLAICGTAYYVDLNASSSGNGSFNNPWNSIQDVNNHNFSNGDDVYFKAGTSSANKPARFNVDWGGVNSSDRAIIGCYWNDGGSPNTDCSGKTMPVIDGDGKSTSLTPQYQSLIMIKNQSEGYFTVEWLHVKNSGWNGITIDSSGDYNIIQNTFTDGCVGNNIVISDTEYTKVQDNEVRGSSNFGNRTAFGYRNAGAAITVIDGNNNEVGTNYNEILRNKVYQSWEGIGIYIGPRYSLVEGNVIHDNHSYHLYMGNSRNTTARYNLVYESSSNPDNKDGMIFIGCEAWESWPLKVTGNNTVYGNFVAGGLKGIAITSSCGPDSNVWSDNNKIYNNTIVDCDYNFYFNNISGSSGNEITNNISWTTTSAAVHSNNYSPSGVTWSHNLFDDSVSGKAATNAITNNPKLAKTSGWRALSAGEITGREFMPQAGSQVIDAGTDYNGFPGLIDTDFTADPIILRVASPAANSIADIGAYMSPIDDIDDILAPPSGFRIVSLE